MMASMADVTAAIANLQTALTGAQAQRLRNVDRLASAQNNVAAMRQLVATDDATIAQITAALDTLQLQPPPPP